MNIPSTLKYTKDHEWVKIDGEMATIGITDFAQHELGDIVYVEIESIGEMLVSEEVFGSVEAVKTVSDLFMPLSGEVLEFSRCRWSKKLQKWRRRPSAAVATPGVVFVQYTGIA